MPPRRVIVVHETGELIARQLLERLRRSDSFVVVSDRIWLAREIEEHLARRAPVDWAGVALVCPAARNRELSQALLALHPDLVIFRIDTDLDPLVSQGAVSVDVVQHLSLDQTRVGFDRLLRAMLYLLEHHGVGPEDRLVRYLVLGDTDSAGGEGVRFLELKHGTRQSDQLRKLPREAIAWLNAVIAEYFERYPATQPDGGSFFLSRQRAVALLDALDRSARERAPPSADAALAAATRALAALLNDPAPPTEPLVLLKRGLGITFDDLRAFIVCLAPEIDLGYQLIFGHIHDDMNRRFATAGLIDALMSGHASSTATASISALLQWRLMSGDAACYPNADNALQPDPAILQWLMVGGDALLADAPVRAATSAQAWPGRDLVTARSDATDEIFLAGRLSGRDAEKQWTVLSGADVEGWKALLERSAVRANVGLLRISMQRFAQLDPRLQQDAAIRISRAARLMGRRSVVDCAIDSVDATALATLVHAHTEFGGSSFLVVLEARTAATVLPVDRWQLRARSAPNLASRAHHFAETLSGLRLVSDEGVRLTAAERLASAYPLGLEGLSTAAALTTSRITDKDPAERRMSVFADSCRRVAAPDLLQLAHRLEPVFELDQVIVPDDRKALLREIVANVRHGRRVLEEWGFATQLPYGRGIAALFAGPSGTGKTMAAQAIARHLGVDVFAVDLSRIVSKYIGETEKHLDAVFVDAERSGSVLLFDEADALFGKRSEVKDAHDRYANIEVAFLLQRMEAFGGLAILTTNSRQNLDAAFARRLRFIVDFPRPDASARETIWRHCMPADAPLGRDIDWRLLSRFDLSGGVIRQVTLRAAFIAAQASARVIGMAHLLTALRSEFGKLGMQTAERDLAELERLRTHDKSAAA